MHKQSGPDPARPGLSPVALQRVNAHIESALGLPNALCELADVARLSRFHFARQFKRSTGLPPHRYLMARRLARAQQMVEGTRRPLADIALELGFADQSHLTRAFARAVGETPRRMRLRAIATLAAGGFEGRPGSR
jgi:AraC family transcriptional regulator